MEPPQFEYLVSFRDRKKLLSAHGQTEADLLEALKRTDFGYALPTCRIEVYNARYEEYIDPPAGHVFSDKDKIRLVCNENLQMYCSTSDKVTVVPGGSLPENGESNGQQPSQQLTCTDGEYKLPPVPLDIKDAIDRTEPGKVSSKTKSRIVGWIANHLMTIRVYPGSLYEAASRALVLEYPALRDTIGTGWTADLSQHVAAQHDAATVNSHVEFMMNEVKRPNSDMIKLRDSMLQTRPARQQWIKEMRPPTGDVLNKYPALANAEMLHEEFTALTGVKLEEKILQFINQYGNRLFELAKCRRSSKEAIAGIEAELDKLEGDEKKYRFAVGVFELLPFLLKETPRFLQGPDTYPALSFKGACAATATDIIASFEGFQVEAVDIIAGMTALIELYWVFDVKYSNVSKKTFTVLEHFCGLPPTSTKKMPLVIRLISSLEQTA
ncbi:uncharacterized protein LOC125941891 isoform X2 [Dermacentor silvarum]|uniref:uncharacterized protein LOC125941891 isoform X2 n=1 Tax=Dermacentor silvarum TaxID=543639 RepID=UPI002101D1B1|nr:uncharacterized protein LOC125941891 isoform X2 [Dermacentor silvarum]